MRPLLPTLTLVLALADTGISVPAPWNHAVQVRAGVQAFKARQLETRSEAASGLGGGSGDGGNDPHRDSKGKFAKGNRFHELRKERKNSGTGHSNKYQRDPETGKVTIKKFSSANQHTLSASQLPRTATVQPSASSQPIVRPAAPSPPTIRTISLFGVQVSAPSPAPPPAAPSPATIRTMNLFGGQVSSPSPAAPPVAPVPSKRKTARTGHSQRYQLNPKTGEVTIKKFNSGNQYTSSASRPPQTATAQPSSQPVVRPAAPSPATIQAMSLFRGQAPSRSPSPSSSRGNPRPRTFH